MKPEPRTTRPAAAPGRIDAFLACCVVAACAAIAAGLAWTRPTTTNSVLPYTQSGRLSYSARVNPHSVYGSDRLASGQPVYLSAVRNLQLRYSYSFGTSLPAILNGSEQLVVAISNGQGITRTIPLQTRTDFTARGFVARATLHLAAIESVASTFDQATGGITSGTYAVKIMPSVRIRGTLAGARLATSFDQPVSFSFGSGALTPTPSAPASSGSFVNGAPPPPSAPKLAVSEPGALTMPHACAARLFGASVADVRLASLAVLVAALLTAVLLGRRLLAALTSDDERVRITSRHGLWIVDADALPGDAVMVTVVVSSFDGLLHVARRLQCPVLRVAGDPDTYAVVDNGTLYRYASPAPTSEEGASGGAPRRPDRHDRLTAPSSTDAPRNGIANGGDPSLEDTEQSNGGAPGRAPSRAGGLAGSSLARNLWVVGAWVLAASLCAGLAAAGVESPAGRLALASAVVVFGVLAVRAARVGAYVRPKGVIVRGVFRSVSLSWDEVRLVAPSADGRGTGFWVSIPCKPTRARRRGAAGNVPPQGRTVYARPSARLGRLAVAPPAFE